MIKKLEQSKKQKEEIKNLKKKKKNLTKKLEDSERQEDRFGGAATNKIRAAPEQFEPTYRADGGWLKLYKIRQNFFRGI